MVRIASAIIRSMRPAQWTKNFFVFAGLIFAQEFLNPDKVLLSLEAFGVFCLLASGVYILNDIVDLPADRLHPVKRRRPLPSGELPLWVAALASLAFVAAGILWAFCTNTGLGFIGLSYVVMQIFYSLWLKHVVIVDIIVVAAGFLLRAAAGAVVLGVKISSWLLLCTSLLALFMVTAKRRQELARIVHNNEKASRKVIEHYNLRFLSDLLLVEVAATLTSYSLYVFDPQTAARFGTPYLWLSLPFVIYGLFRYLYLVEVRGEGESPERLVLRDPFMLANLVLWGVTVVAIIYFKPGG